MSKKGSKMWVFRILHRVFHRHNAFLWIYRVFKNYLFVVQKERFSEVFTAPTPMVAKFVFDINAVGGKV